MSRHLYQAADRIEAQRLIDHLEFHGIATVLVGDYLAGAAGELPANLYPCVWLTDERDQVRAQVLLQEFLGPVPREPGPGWCCPQCGEALEAGFEFCWQCGTQKP